MLKQTILLQTTIVRTTPTTNSYNNHIKPVDNYIDLHQQARVINKTQVNRKSYIWRNEMMLVEGAEIATVI